jgi:hypothetical protein
LFFVVVVVVVVVFVFVFVVVAVVVVVVFVVVFFSLSGTRPEDKTKEHIYTTCQNHRGSLCKEGKLLESF